jgi:hypothetical protein
MTVQDQEAPRSLQLTFFLEDIYPWRKWRCNTQNITISDAIPSVFHVAILIQPYQLF